MDIISVGDTYSEAGGAAATITFRKPLLSSAPLTEECIRLGREIAKQYGLEDDTEI